MSNVDFQVQELNVADVLSRPDITQLKTYDKVKCVCEYILETRNIRDNNVALSSSELFESAKIEFPLIFQNFSRATFFQYLSNIAKDTESQINCLGKKKGYYLSAIAKSIEKLIEQPQQEVSLVGQELVNKDKEQEKTRSRVQKEVLLYPVLETWLIAQGYQSSDISSGRIMGRWGNPDLAGINAIDNFNGLSLELVTIEAKVSLENWEQWIFEAVAHRRFANRSYFAFAHPDETISKIPKDMRYYAELYNIGVLVLALENDVFTRLVAGELVEPLQVEDVDILEIYSAPYNFVQPRYQLKFCSDALGITSIKKLYQWGKKSSEI